ncbi:MAG: hypothetical protein ACREF1_12970 [Acetobacteraceae bacterium]
MALLRCGLALALAFGVCGCAAGGPDRASDIQNLNAIADDISAVTMTQSQSEHVHDPNLPTTLPNSYSTVDMH